MKTVVVSIKRSVNSKDQVTNVVVTFDDNPFQFLDELDKPQNADAEQQQLISLAQSIVAEKISGNEIDLTIGNPTLRTHVLISGKKNGALLVDYTFPHGVHCLDTSSTKPNLETLLQDKFPKATLSDNYSEMGAEQTLMLPQIPEYILDILRDRKNSAAAAKEKRNLAKQKEEFLTKGPLKFPDPVAFPASIKTTAKGDINLKNVVGKLSTLYGEQSKLNSVHQQIEAIEKEIEALEKQLTELKEREASLGEAMGKDTRVASFAKSNLQASRTEVQQTKVLVEKTISIFRANLSETKKSFSEHVTNNYSQYELYENTLEFTKKVMLAALYNAALDNYKQIIDGTKGNAANREKKIQEFNRNFAEIANIDEYGNVNPIESTYKYFADKSLLDVVTFTNEVIKKCNRSELSVIQARLEGANKHCVNQYKTRFNDLIYTDAAKKMPFIMEKSLLGFGWLQKINLNIELEYSLNSTIQSAFAPEKIDNASSKIPNQKDIGEQQSVLKTAQTKLADIEQKVRNFKRYIELKDKIEERKILASNQKQQIDEVRQSFNKVRDSIVDQIKDQPLEVQQYVLENIKPQFAKSVLSQLSENSRKTLAKNLPLLATTSEALRIPEDLITNSVSHLITDSGVFDHFNASRSGLSFKGV
ncbi:hypothetical protein ELY20_16380 [Legionella qingyii]|uniref:Uncharacterized protein n=2 Tax=Legionella qingyii TaxID=2184757 RepID=A0ABY0CDH2_9GAMM|nr:hypothetical protein [Legionella qingyii]RUR18780.1 hypothetical protein ELY20_16380 [Legionella qingyii]